MAYSEFLTLVHSGNVKTAGIDDSADKIYFNLNGHSSQQAAEAAPAEAAAPAAATASSLAPASASAVEASSGEFDDCTLVWSDVGLRLVFQRGLLCYWSVPESILQPWSDRGVWSQLVTNTLLRLDHAMLLDSFLSKPFVCGSSHGASSKALKTAEDTKAHD